MSPTAGFLGVVGSILRALVGYTSSPEWITLLAWLVYVVVVLFLYTRPVRPADAKTPHGRADRSRSLIAAGPRRCARRGLARWASVVMSAGFVASDEVEHLAPRVGAGIGEVGRLAIEERVGRILVDDGAMLHPRRVEGAVERLARLGRDAGIGPAVQREHRAAEGGCLVRRGRQTAAMRPDRPWVEADDARQARGRTPLGAG